MIANSKTITSNQTETHPDLAAVVQRHLNAEFRQPFKSVSHEIFQRIRDRVLGHKGPLIFDSGCGTGDSTFLLGLKHPDCLVIGIDKSEMRTIKADFKLQAHKNVVLVRAELIDIWRMANQAGWRLQHHYLLYPNPWPKKRQFKRRWHGHPVFPELLALGGTLHLRSNWKLYLEEFAAAVKVAKSVSAPVSQLTIEEPVSAFEKKYWLSGQALFEYQVVLG